jgi:hypothetical protein
LTLVELLVAMAIFAFLGTATVGVLRSGLFSWRTGEAKREVLETAQLIMSQVADDLRNMYTCESVEGRAPYVRLVADRDANGRQRIRFVRTISGAVSPYARKEAGALVGADSDLDLVDDYTEARMGSLRSTSGLCEMAYVMDTNPASAKLYRGLRAPIGGAGTFFVNSNLVPATSNSPLIEFTDGVLYLGFHFWTQYTNTWDVSAYPIVAPRPDEKSGPALYWDSTRSLMFVRNPVERQFTTYLSASSEADTGDDIFPTAVQVMLVLVEGESGASSRLTRDIEDNSTRIPVEDESVFEDLAYPYVCIDTEWVRFNATESKALALKDEYDRGARGTVPASHRKGALVQAGRTFVITIELPGGREDWNAK